MEEFRTVTVICHKCKEKNCHVLNTSEDVIVECTYCGSLLFELNKIDGFIYVMSNSSLKEMFKIGFTSKYPKLREDQLSSSTSIPTPFNLELVFPAQHLTKTERDIHLSLDEYRVAKNREFFRINLDHIFKIISRVTRNKPSYISKGISMLNGGMKDYYPWDKEIYNEFDNKHFSPEVFSIGDSFICQKCGNRLKSVFNQPGIVEDAAFKCINCNYYTDIDGNFICYSY
jgi:DNA-directed RNA polymerase subunit RPC12/RpoP